MSWLGGRTSLGEVLGLRAPLGGQVEGLRTDAAATAPGRTAQLITARVEQLVSGEGSLASFGPLTPGEQTVVDIADQFLLDAHGIDDALMASLGQHYTAAEQVGLLFHLALADGFAKFGRVFGVSEEAR
jgi:hypothetical protein